MSHNILANDVQVCLFNIIAGIRTLILSWTRKLEFGFVIQKSNDFI